MVTAISLFVLISSCASPTSPAGLSKVDATKLLGFMGYQNIVIATVVNGVGGMGLASLSSPNVAMVIGYGEKVPGGPQEIRETFFLDKDLGWMYVEIDKEGHRVRLWTISGYKELKPVVTRD